MTILQAFLAGVGLMSVVFALTAVVWLSVNHLHVYIQ